MIKDFARHPGRIHRRGHHQTPTLVTPSGVAGLTFIDEAEGVNRAADELRAKGVRAMVAVFHEGIEIDRRADWNDTSCPGAAGPLLDIARRLAPEIKVVFSGHTHRGYRCEVDGRLLIQGTAYGRGVSVVDVELDRSTRAMLPPVRSLNLPVLNERTEAAMRDKLVAATPQPFAQGARARRSPMPRSPRGSRPTRRSRSPRPIAWSHASAAPSPTAAPTVPTRRRRASSPTRSSPPRAEPRRAGRAHESGRRARGLLCAAPPCPVTFGQVFTVQPFGNSLVVMNLTGEQLKRALEQRGAPSGEPYLLHPSEGFTYTWPDDAPRGAQVTRPAPRRDSRSIPRRRTASP